jgi:HEAT repeat protein
LINDSNSTDPLLRADAIEALQETSPHDGASDAALKGLTDPDAAVRFSACMAVGQLQLDAAHDMLVQMHDIDPSPVVQVGIRFALHRLGDTRFSHDLETYAKDANPQIRGKTAFVLGLLKEPSAVKLLLIMRQDNEPAVRLQASASLWRLGNDKGLSDLVRYAISEYADDQLLATLALAETGDASVSQHIRANLTTDFPEVNLAAARGLGQLGSDEGYTVAAKGAASHDARQRFLAVLALGAIGRADAQPVLAKLVYDSDVNVRLGAATAILQLHGAREQAK